MHLYPGIGALIILLPTILKKIFILNIFIFYCLSLSSVCVYGLLCIKYKTILYLSYFENTLARLIINLFFSILLMVGLKFTDSTNKTTPIHGIYISIALIISIIFPGSSRTGVLLTCMYFLNYSH